MKLMHTVRAAALALAALFVLAFPSSESRANDCTVDACFFSGGQIQGLRDTFMSKKAAQCVNIHIPSLAESSSPGTAVPWNSTIVDWYVKVNGSTTYWGTTNPVQLYNNGVSTLVGAASLSGTDTAASAPDEGTINTSNDDVDGGQFVVATSPGTAASAVTATVTVCFQPDDSVVGRP